MPNWCSNSVTFEHSNPAEIQRMVSAFAAGKLMREFYPYPEELDIVAGSVGAADSPEQIDLVAKSTANLEKHGFANWYDWCVANWGTKWDVDGSDGYTQVDDNTVSVYFDSAWSPPLGFYEHMVDELGWSIEAYYYEPGMSFCGKWINGDDEEYVIEGNSDWVLKNIPAAIDEMFSISANMSEWEAEDEELNDDKEETENE